MSLSRALMCGLLFFAWLALLPAIPVRAAEEFRTWSDSTGRFHVRAKLVSAEGGKVLLAREDGARLTIPLDRLSKADQDHLASRQAENPFKPEEQSPFVPAPVPPARESSSEGPRMVTVDWSLKCSPWSRRPPSGRSRHRRRPRPVFAPSRLHCRPRPISSRS